MGLLHLRSIAIIYIFHYATHGCHQLRGWIRMLFWAPASGTGSWQRSHCFEWLHYSAVLESYLICCQNEQRVDLCWPFCLLNAYNHCLCFRMWRKRKNCALISLTRRSDRRSSSTTQTHVTTLKWHWWVNDLWAKFKTSVFVSSDLQKISSRILLNFFWIKSCFTIMQKAIFAIRQGNHKTYSIKKGPSWPQN